MKNFIFKSLLFLFVSPSLFAQSPWTREKNKAYVQLGFTGLFFNQAQIDGTKTNLSSDFSDVTLQVYSEYGITDRLEAQLILPYKLVGYKNTTLNVSDNYSGIGNITLGLKYNLYNENWKISTGFQLAPRTSSFDASSGLSTGFNAVVAVPYVAAGSSIGKWYYFGTLGYGYMSNDYSDYLKADAEVGYNVLPKAHVIVAFNTRNVLNKETAFTNDDRQWISYSDRQTYNAFGLKFNYEFIKEKLGANFSTFGAFGNDNAPLAPTFNLALYLKL